jgi:hypothetical protein
MVSDDKRLEVEKYGLHAYDDFLCLRPSKLLIASLIFLCRDLIFLVLLGVSRFIGAAEGVAGLEDIVDRETLLSGCIAAVPAALVLYALGARMPTAPAFVRFIWRHGRSLMAVSALTSIALTVVQYGSDPRRWLNSSLAVKAIVLAELGIVGYVFLSSRVRQTFMDFPPP